MNRLETIIDLLQRGRAPEIKLETQAALDEGISAASILEDGLMEGKGLVVIDLGVDVAPEKYADAAKEHNAQIIACSALLTTTMTEMKRVVEAAVAAGIRDSVKIMIGGAPVTESYKLEIGADFYSADAASASDVAVQACLGMAG
ncbi:MAG: cobalamin B12-binding domain-containing protein [Bacteroidetes bacterium]|nr:cobalamin B12-binding domain-containing protein [Bacteroidota bacterium]